MTVPNLEAQFNQWAPNYDSDVRHEAGFPFAGYERVLNRVISLARIGPGMEVLELGPGTGNLTRKLVDSSATVWALDFSGEMLAIAQKKVPEAHFGQVDLQAEYPSQFRRKFYRVVSTYTLHEFPLAGKIAILRRLVDSFLMPGGAIVIGDIGFSNVAALGAVKVASGEAWDDEYYWIQDEVEIALRDNGMAMTWEQLSICSAVIEITRMTR